MFRKADSCFRNRYLFLIDYDFLNKNREEDQLISKLSKIIKILIGLLQLNKNVLDLISLDIRYKTFLFAKRNTLYLISKDIRSKVFLFSLRIFEIFKNTDASVFFNLKNTDADSDFGRFSIN